MLPAKLQPFVTISYPVWGVENGHRVLLYKKGRNDLYFVLFMTAFFAVLRHVTMNWLFAPIAHRYMHVPNTLKTEGADKATKERRLRAYAKKKQHAVIRFAEQGWNMLYCLVMEVIGLVSFVIIAAGEDRT